MPRGVKRLDESDTDQLIDKCPKGRERLHPAAVTVIRTWLLMVGSRHQKAGAAARRAYDDAHDAAQLGIIQREARAVQLIAELVAIASDRWDRTDWHDAASQLWDVQQEGRGLSRGTA